RRTAQRRRTGEREQAVQADVVVDLAAAVALAAEAEAVTHAGGLEDLRAVVAGQAHAQHVADAVVDVRDDADRLARRALRHADSDVAVDADATLTERHVRRA